MKRENAEPETALAETLRQLSRKLDKLASNIREPVPVRQPVVPTSSNFKIADDQMVEAVDALAKRRGRKRAYFPAEIVREPAWDMLLELFLAHKKGVRLSTTSLCLVGGVPCSTALRVTGLLEAKGLLERYRSGNDKRVIYVRITPKGCTQMEAFVSDEVLRRIRQLKDPASKWAKELEELENLGLVLA